MPWTIAAWALAAALLVAAPGREAAAETPDGATTTWTVPDGAATTTWNNPDSATTTWSVPDGAISASLNVGTLGLGLSAGYSFSPSLALRALVNRYDFDYDTEDDGTTYRGDLQLESYGLLLDWHPFDNSFRFTGGAFLNANEITAAAMDDIKVGNSRYDGSVRAKVGFDDIAPYLGIGWTTGRKSSGFSFVAEIGVLFQDEPKLSADATLSDPNDPGASNCRVAVNEAGEASFGGGTPGCPNLFSTRLRNDIEQEHRDLADDLKDFDVYPVLLIGVSYRF